MHTVPVTIKSAVIDDVVVIMNLKNNCYHVLNPTASEIWCAMFTKDTERATHPSLLQADVDLFISDCFRLGILEIDCPSAVANDRPTVRQLGRILPAHGLAGYCILHANLSLRWRGF